MPRVNKLYKAKTIDENPEWVQGYIWTGADHAYIIPKNIDVGFSDNELRAYAVEVNPDTICECCDLMSCNAGLLFENDIVETQLYHDIMVIEYKDYQLFARIVDTQTSLIGVYKSLALALNDFAFEIKGNIFDNPELLNK